MIAGRFHRKTVGTRPRGKHDLAAFHFSNQTMMLTEASPKHRAALYVVAGTQGLADHRRGGLEVLQSDESQFREVMLRENHTLQRALTDPRLISGIGNAYSDEILHAARLSPIKQTRKLTDDEISRLFVAAKTTLQRWISVLSAEVGKGFPERVTAFRPQMAVHGHEPSQGLAPKIVQDVLHTIRRLKAEGVACLIVEQNALAALEVADRVYVMDRGRIVHEGVAAALLADTGLRQRLIGM
jgi:formamidopyrimidine-DNA glycosylase